MGRTVEELKDVMTEREFRLHCYQMSKEPEVLDKIEHHMRLVAFLLNQIAGSGLVFGKAPFEPEHLIPWGK